MRNALSSPPVAAADPRSGALRAEAGPPTPATVLNPQIAAILPADLLQPGEVIILLLKPSPWYILLAPLRTLVLLALSAVLAVALANRGWLGLSPRETLVIFLGLALARLSWQVFEWLSRIYILTDRRVIRLRGVLRVHLFESPLKSIQHTTAYYSVRERLLGLGSLGFATSGTGMTEAWWEMVARPREVHRIVVQTLQRYR